jgi:hypothetical protein
MRDENGKKVPSKRVAELKAIEKYLLEKAAELPVMFEDCQSSRVMLGKDILNDDKILGTMTAEQVKAIEPNEKYNIPGTESRPVDHYKRMKNMLKKKGVEAVAEYYKQVIVNVSEVIATPVTIGGIKTELDYGNPVRNF